MRNNEVVKKLIGENGLRQWKLADAIGVSEATLCVWLRKPLTEERYNLLLNGIEKLKGGK